MDLILDDKHSLKTILLQFLSTFPLLISPTALDEDAMKMYDSAM